jgi:hypothetical protein
MQLIAAISYDNHNVYSSLNIINIIKSRRIKWESRIVRMNDTTFWPENLKVRAHLEERGADRKPVLNTQNREQILRV